MTVMNLKPAEAIVKLYLKTKQNKLYVTYFTQQTSYIYTEVNWKTISTSLENKYTRMLNNGYNKNQLVLFKIFKEKL